MLLPGVSTLARLVARVRDAAMQRLWDTLAAPLTAAQAHALELLLEIPDGARTSDLERLRRGPTRVSGRAMPYVRRHLNVHGHYSFQLPDLVGTRRALRDPDSSDDEEG